MEEERGRMERIMLNITEMDNWSLCMTLSIIHSSQNAFSSIFTYWCLMILLLIIFIISKKLLSVHFLRKISTFPFPYLNTSLGLDLPPPRVPTLELLKFNKALVVLLFISLWLLYYRKWLNVKTLALQPRFKIWPVFATSDLATVMTLNSSLCQISGPGSYIENTVYCTLSMCPALSRHFTGITLFVPQNNHTREDLPFSPQNRWGIEAHGS